MPKAWLAIILGLAVLIAIYASSRPKDSNGDNDGSSSTPNGNSGPSSNSDGGNSNSGSNSSPSATTKTNTKFNVLVGTTRSVKRAEFVFTLPSGDTSMTSVNELMMPGKTEYKTITFTKDGGVALLYSETGYALKTVSGNTMSTRGTDVSMTNNVQFAFAPDSSTMFVLGNGSDRKQVSTATNAVTSVLSTFSKKSNPLADVAVVVNGAGDLAIFATSAKTLHFHHTKELGKARICDPSFVTVPTFLACSPTVNQMIVAFGAAGAGQARLRCISFASGATDQGVAFKDVWVYAPTDVFQADMVTYLNESTVVYARKSGTSTTYGDVGIVFNANMSTPVHRSFSLIDAVGKQIPSVENRTRTNDISAIGPSSDPNIFFVGTTDGKVYMCYLRPSSSSDATLTVIVRVVEVATFDRITSIASFMTR